MELEIINKLYLELSQVATAKTKRELELENLQTKVDAITSPWQPMRTAPKDGFAVLVLLDGSDAPHCARWLRGTDDPHATEATKGPGWHLTWDGSPVAPHDGPRYWMHCPSDPDA